MPPLPNPPLSKVADTRTVSWQTAFWALFTLALNTIVQNPGILINSKAAEVLLPAPGRLLRMSPIFCFLDTLHIAGSVIAVVCTRLPPLQAFQIVARWRQLGKGDADTATTNEARDDMELSPLPSGQNQPPPSLMPPLALPPLPAPRRSLNHYLLLRVLVGLGALIQLVKLMGFRGVPGTQAAGCAYFISYLVFEALEWTAVRNHGQPTETYPPALRALDRIDRVAKVLQDIGRTVQTQLWVWVCFVYVKGGHGIERRPDGEGFEFYDYQHSLRFSWAGYLFFFLASLSSLAGLFFILWASYFLTVALFELSLRSLFSLSFLIDWRRNGLSPVPETWINLGEGVLIIAGWVMTGLLLPRAPDILPLAWYLGVWLYATLVLIVVGSPVFMAGRLWGYRVQARSIESQYEKMEKSWECAKTAFEIFLSLSMSLFYYCVLYSPDGTLKPEWTESLG